MRLLVLFLSLFFLSCASAQENTKPNLVALKEVEVAKVDLRLFPDQAQVRAPEKFKVKFVTTAGDFVIAIERLSAPLGVDRFYSLVKANFYEDIIIFRAMEGFMFQFGIHGEPEINNAWKEQTIEDDPIRELSNTTGAITFAHAGPNTRTTQLFINLGDNSRLDGQKFVPFGRVVEGLETVKRVNTEYGENVPSFQGDFQEFGNAHAEEIYPNLDRITKIVILEEE